MKNEPEWIEWESETDECPVPSRDVEVKFRDGKIERDKTPQGWCWEWSGSEGDIIAYRDWTAFYESKKKTEKNHPAEAFGKQIEMEQEEKWQKELAITLKGLSKDQLNFAYGYIVSRLESLKD